MGWKSVAFPQYVGTRGECFLGGPVIQMDGFWVSFLYLFFNMFINNMSPGDNLLRICSRKLRLKSAS